MSQDEITKLWTVVNVSFSLEARPFLSDKFDITKHKNYKLLEDYDKKVRLI